jgi:hypothetical protein
VMTVIDAPGGAERSAGPPPAARYRWVHGGVG